MVAKAIPPLPGPHKLERYDQPHRQDETTAEIGGRTGAAARSGSQVSISRASLARSWPRPSRKNARISYLTLLKLLLY